MIVFEENTESDDIKQIAELAAVIWTEHYVPIIGPEQVRYMLEKYQSPEAIRRQIAEENYRYFTVRENATRFGYCAVKQEDDGSLFLSKYYIARSHRSRGFGKALLRFALSQFSVLPETVVWLTVNRNNDHSIAAYRKMGFAIAGELKTKIGNGFIMDDYRLESTVSVLQNQTNSRHSMRCQ